MSRLDDIFTHIEVLKSREPEVNECHLLSYPFGDMPKKCVEVKADTPSALLELICIKKYDDKPIFKEEKLKDGRFSAQYTVHGIIGEGIANSKKSAKQLAARQVLLTIIERGKHRELLIPGETAKDAEEYVNSMKFDLEVEEENWIAKCNNYCQQKKVDLPSITFSEEPHMNGKMFTCTAKLGINITGTGSFPKKKMAQHLAFKQVYEQLVREYGPFVSRPQTPADNATNMNSSPTASTSSPGSSNSLKKASNLSPISGSSSTTELGAFLRQIFQEAENESTEEKMDSKFPSNFDYEAALNTVASMHDTVVAKVYDLSADDALKFTFADASDVNDEEYYQVYLDIRSSSRTRPENVFGGQGATRKAAKNDAARQALEFLYLFGNFRQN